MVDATNEALDPPSSPDLGDPTIGATDLPTPTSTHSGESSPTHLDTDEGENTTLPAQKKKKKKKPKKSAKAKEAAAALKAKALDCPDPDGRPPVLCISRNKHWRYISSYHVRRDFCPVATPSHPVRKLKF